MKLLRDGELSCYDERFDSFLVFGDVTEKLGGQLLTLVGVMN